MDKPFIFRSNDVNEFDELQTFEVIEVKATRLREGVVMVDEHGFPIALIDHRLPTTPRSGEVRFMFHDFESGGVAATGIHQNRMVKVAAA